MGSNALGQIATVFSAIVGVAILAVLVSRNSQTPAVIQSAGRAFSDSLRAATGPVMGSGFGGSFAQGAPQF
jgi:hypothetical protein